MFLSPFIIVGLMAFLKGSLWASPSSDDHFPSLPEPSPSSFSPHKPALELSVKTDSPEDFFTHIPDEIVMNIFLLLQHPHDVLNLGSTCKRLYHLSRTSTVYTLNPVIQMGRLIMLNPGYGDTHPQCEQIVSAGFDDLGELICKKINLTQYYVLNKTLEASLKINPSFLYLDLKHLEAESIKALFTHLQTNQAIQGISLFNLKILSKPMALEMESMLSQNTVLRSFCLLAHKQCKDSFIEIIGRALSKNGSLKDIEFEQNKTQKTELESLVQSLEKNKALSTLQILITPQDALLKEDLKNDLFLNLLRIHPHLKEIRIGFYSHSPFIVFIKNTEMGSISVRGTLGQTSAPS